MKFIRAALAEVSPAAPSKRRDMFYCVHYYKDAIQPQYRLRVEGFRVFYDVSNDVVEVLAVVPKSGTSAWLEEMGKVE